MSRGLKLTTSVFVIYLDYISKKSELRDSFEEGFNNIENLRGNLR